MAWESLVLTILTDCPGLLAANPSFDIRHSLSNNINCRPNHYFFFGLITMTIWRPSIFGNCSTTPNGSRSAFTLSSSLKPNS